MSTPKPKSTLISLYKRTKPSLLKKKDDSFYRTCLLTRELDLNTKSTLRIKIIKITPDEDDNISIGVVKS